MEIKLFPLQKFTALTIQMPAEVHIAGRGSMCTSAVTRHLVACKVCRGRHRNVCTLTCDLVPLQPATACQTPLYLPEAWSRSRPALFSSLCFPSVGTQSSLAESRWGPSTGEIYVLGIVYLSPPVWSASRDPVVKGPKAKFPFRLNETNSSGLRSCKIRVPRPRSCTPHTYCCPPYTNNLDRIVGSGWLG